MLDAPKIPMPGSKWVHYKGFGYVVVGYARREGSQEIMIIYRDYDPDDEDISCWTRPLHEFLGLVRFIDDDNEERTVRRFEEAIEL